MKKIKIYDTTLRDGTQMKGFSLDVQDKITVAKTLDDLGVAYIEGGWPGSNPRDEAFFEAMKDVKFKNAKLVTFGATYHKKFKSASECPLLKKALAVNAPVACIFGKTWKLHTELLGITPEENFRIIEDTVQFLKFHNLEVYFDAEHFFDGYLDDKDFALECLNSAVKGGVDNLTLCDTNGCMIPYQIKEIVKNVVEKFPEISIGIHVHNDGGLAVANSLTAVKAGCDVVQGTMNGFGERCGNADLCSVIPNLELKMGYSVIGKENLKKLTKVSKIVGGRGNYAIPKNLPFVGESAFAHKGGIHVSAVNKNPKSYEAIVPELVGNRREITVSDLSGKSNLLAYGKKLGLNLDDFDTNFWKKVLEELKKAEQSGLQFEDAEASFDVFFQKLLSNFKPKFTLNNFFVHTEKAETKGEDATVEATVSGIVNSEKFHTAGFGCGPVDALNEALRKGLEPIFPELKKVKLTDFKVRIVAMESGTEAKTRVVAEHTDGQKTWSTVGVSENIIEASMMALIDAFEWYLLKIR